MRNHEQTVRWVAIVVMLIIAGFSGYTTWSQQAYQYEMETLRNDIAVESTLVTDLRIQTAIVMTTMTQLADDVKEIKETIKQYVDGE